VGNAQKTVILTKPITSDTPTRDRALATGGEKT